MNSTGLANGVRGNAAVASKYKVVVARGDGIGPEIMDAVLRILEAVNAPLSLEEIEIGESVYRRGVTSGIEPEAWETLRSAGTFLKAPITTPLGHGYKSLNVTARKSLSLYANVRPVRSYDPYVTTKHPGMDVVVVRENEEDTYGGIEHRQTDEVAQCLKLITRPGTERIVRFAFEYARAHGRNKVSCFTKQNIMKITDGLFYRIFQEIAPEYPDIETDHWLIDIGTAMLADQPNRFDVIVTPNLYGDIISDVAAQIAGSVGLAGSANVGPTVAMFEAVHGSAPDIAGRDRANPSGLLNAAVMMLAHLGAAPEAQLIQNAWLATLERGYHTPDIANDSTTTEVVGTQEFADRVIYHLGEEPERLQPARFPVNAVRADDRAGGRPSDGNETHTAPARKHLVGVDVFLDWDESGRDAAILGVALEAACPPRFRLSMITNRGTKVYPNGLAETFCTDHWRCRFVASGDNPEQRHLLELWHALTEAGFEIIKTEHLYRHGDEDGFSRGQGE